MDTGLSGSASWTWSVSLVLVVVASAGCVSEETPQKATDPVDQIVNGATEPSAATARRRR